VEDPGAAGHAARLTINGRPPDPRLLQRARVILHDGEELQLERTSDLGEGNAGILIFVDGREHPEYVPWTDVEQVDLDRPPSGHR
jgi:hypothetical protein